MPRLVGIALAFVVLTGCSRPLIATADYALMPESNAKALLRQCSRGTPDATGAWTPTNVQVGDLENHLPLLAKLAERQRLPQSIGDPKASFRQYVGIVVNQHRFIYINAIPADAPNRPPFPDRYVKPAAVCDGGSAFWGALYDPVTKTFSDLNANGVA